MTEKTNDNLNCKIKQIKDFDHKNKNDYELKNGKENNNINKKDIHENKDKIESYENENRIHKKRKKDISEDLLLKNDDFFSSLLKEYGNNSKWVNEIWIEFVDT